MVLKKQICKKRQETHLVLPWPNGSPAPPEKQEWPNGLWNEWTIETCLWDKHNCHFIDWLSTVAVRNKCNKLILTWSDQTSTKASHWKRFEACNQTWCSGAQPWTIYKWSQVVGELVNCRSIFASSSLDHRLDSPVRKGQATGVLWCSTISQHVGPKMIKQIIEHVHWSTTGKAYVSRLLNIQDLLFCRHNAREATKRGHKTGSALVLVPLASLVVSAVDDEWHWGDHKFSQRRYMIYIVTFLANGCFW